MKLTGKGKERFFCAVNSININPLMDAKSPAHERKIRCINLVYGWLGGERLSIKQCSVMTMLLQHVVEVTI